MLTVIIVQIWQSEQKFPYTSARATEASKSAFGSVKGTVINMYDSSVYYIKGIYNLYTKSDRGSSVNDEELQAMYLSDRTRFTFSIKFKTI